MRRTNNALAVLVLKILRVLGRNMAIDWGWLALCAYLASTQMFLYKQAIIAIEMRQN